MCGIVNVICRKLARQQPPKEVMKAQGNEGPIIERLHWPLQLSPSVERARGLDNEEARDSESIGTWVILQCLDDVGALWRWVMAWVGVVFIERVRVPRVGIVMGSSSSSTRPPRLDITPSSLIQPQ